MMWKEAIAAGAGLLCLVRSEYEKTALSVEKICLRTDKIEADRRLVFLSDLHNNEFGADNERLIQAVEAVKPDAVLSGGDMLVAKRGKADTRAALALLKSLALRYPVFCGNGNHENRMVWQRDAYGDQYEGYRDKLKSAGVTYLENGSAPLGRDIQITGVNLGQAFYQKALLQKTAPMPPKYLEKRLGKPENKSRFQILLAHSPLYFKEYREWGADLTLAGHFHGGTIRLPWLGGVMTPQYQFFLPWCAGIFCENHSWMAVSRGLGTHSINLRLNNRPQLLVVELERV